MSETDLGVLSPEVEKGSKGGRLAIFAIYLAFGPPMGAIIFVVTIVAAGLIGRLFEIATGQPAGSSQLTDIINLLFFFSAMPIIIMLSYLFGGLQAAVTGIIIAVSSGKGRKFGYGLAFLAPVIPSAAALFVLGRGETGLGWFLGVIGVTASLAIRYLFRARFALE